MSEAELMQGCEICHTLFAQNVLIPVENVQYQTWKRVFPLYVCKECAKKISDGLKASEGKNE